MLKLTVSQDGCGDFASISEAVLAVPYELEAETVSYTHLTLPTTSRV